MIDFRSVSIAIVSACIATQVLAAPDRSTGNHPVLTTVSPSEATWHISSSGAKEQSPLPITITVTGKAFRPGAYVQFGRNKLATRFISSTQLTAVLTEDKIDHLKWAFGFKEVYATGKVSVRNPHGRASTSLAFSLSKVSDVT